MFSRTVQDWPLEATINCFAGVCRVSIPVLACDIAFTLHRFFCAVFSSEDVNFAALPTRTWPLSVLAGRGAEPAAILKLIELRADVNPPTGAAAAE